MQQRSFLPLLFATIVLVAAAVYALANSDRAVAPAVREEREECAEIVNNLVMEHVGPQSLICYKINQAIRARGVARER